MRRKIIHDSDCDSPSPPAPAASAPMSPPPKRSSHVTEGVVVIVSSDSDDDPQPSQPSMQLAVIQGPSAAPSEMNALQFAAKFGHFPSASDCAAALAVNSGTPLVQHDSTDDDDDECDGYLWNAVPPKDCQYLDLEAHCVDDTSSGSCGDSDSNRGMTPGFVDDDVADNRNLNASDVAVLQRFFPHTARLL